MDRSIDSTNSLIIHNPIEASIGPPPPLFESEDSGLPISHYIWLVRKSIWMICAFMAVSLIGTYLMSSRLAPVYEAAASVNIDRQAPSGLVGDQAQRSTASSGDADQYIATQIRIVNSDAVLRPVAQRFNLLEREKQLRNLTAEQVHAKKAAPTKLHNLRVVRPPNTYIVQISYRSTDPDFSAEVANAVAKSYIEHLFQIQIASSHSAAGFMEKQIDGLRAKMERSGQALAAFEKELNVINPEEKTNIISSRLLQLNTEYTNAQGERIKKQAIQEALLKGSLASDQISDHGEDLQKLEDRLHEAQTQFAQVRASRGANHPEFKKLQAQVTEIESQVHMVRTQIDNRIAADYSQALKREQMLRLAVAEAKLELDVINSRSFEYQRLKDEADADRKLYDELVKKIREDDINAGFENRNTAIADTARPPSKPVFPNLKLNLLLAAALSLFLGIGGVLLVDSLDTTIRDPEQVNKLFQTELISTLPKIRDTLTTTKLKALSAGPEAAVTAHDDRAKSFTAFEEAIRMLRNSILLGDFDRKLRSILVTSATPGEGKSTIALHLALAHAEQGKRTLLIDADLRRPTVHQKLSLQVNKGLSSVLTGVCAWETAVMRLPGLDTLHVLPGGPSSRRAADLLGSGIVDILDDAARLYDLIIIDSPPLLGFAEPMQLAIAADGVIIAASAGETNRRAINAVMLTLRRLRANILGIVLNRTSKEAGAGYYYYNKYENYYRTEER
jgi:polysaccharide biosynthesis transport protein